MPIFDSTDARRLALADSVLVPVLFFDFETENVPGLNRSRWTDAPSNTTIDGNVYVANNPVYEISLPEVNSELGRELFSLGLLDPEGQWRNVLQDRYTGLRITVRVNFVTQTSPMVVMTPVMTIYSGRAVAMTTEHSNTTGNTLRLVFSGPFAKLDGENGWWTSIHDQAQRDATDTAFQFAHASRDIQWGRGL